VARRDPVDAGRLSPAGQQDPAVTVDPDSLAGVPDDGDGAAEGVTVEHEDRLSTERLVTFGEEPSADKSRSFSA